METPPVTAPDPAIITAGAQASADQDAQTRVAKSDAADAKGVASVNQSTRRLVDIFA